MYLLLYSLCIMYICLGVIKIVISLVNFYNSLKMSCNILIKHSKVPSLEIPTINCIMIVGVVSPFVSETILYVCLKEINCVHGVVVVWSLMLLLHACYKNYQYTRHLVTCLETRVILTNWMDM